MCGITPHALGSCSQTPILFRVYCENHPNHGISWVMQKIKLNKSRAPRASAPRHKTTSTKTPSNPPSRSKPTNKANSTISVLIADDHMFIREAVSALLSTDPGLSIVGEADNGRSALQQTLEKRPDVLLMDIGMPRLNAARQVRNMAPDVKVILLTAFGNDQYIQQVVDGKIHGYILKDSPSNLLTHAIHEVAKGGRFYSPIISRRMRTIYDEATSRGDGKTSPPAVKWKSSNSSPKEVPTNKSPVNSTSALRLLKNIARTSWTNFVSMTRRALPATPSPRESSIIWSKCNSR
jgi:DNA-binding NarL/FixJ family response regulator